MNRRSFLGLIGTTAAGIAMGEDVLEAFARLTHVRTNFPSPWPSGSACTTAQWDALLQEDYVQKEILEAIRVATPFPFPYRVRIATDPNHPKGTMDVRQGGHTVLRVINLGAP